MAKEQPKSPSFRRSPVPVPPAPMAPAAATDPTLITKNLGGLPAPAAGKMMVLTDMTRKNLDHLGWKEGDPIPPELGQRIAAIQRTRAADLAAATHGFAPGSKVKIGRELDITELPQERQDELRQVLSDYKTEMAGQNAREAQAQAINQKMPGASPGVLNAARMAAAAPRSPVGLPTVEFKRSSKPAAPPPPPPEPEPAPMSQEEAVRTALPRPEFSSMFQTPLSNAGSETPEAEAPEKENPENPPDHNHDAGLDSRPTMCPRCLWNISDEFKMEISTRDRQAFMASLLGGDRFTKEFAVGGGTYRFGLRTMSTAEADLVYKQLNCDARAGLLNGDADYFLKMEAYRTCCMLEYIADQRGDRIIDLPPLYEITWEGDDTGLVTHTRLKDILEWVNENAIKNESLRRIVSQQYRQFQRLVEALEAQAAEPNFWSGIE